ncbi:hypothetical protein BU15DRAFT_82098 [Melanogaster broomeanus]|nr:hypothetical protein BU15DRAFT_82098 [Melanogaster broomeanus]
MPPPVAVYVVAAITGVAAVLAFKELIYEPHIAPALESWAENFLERRRTARNRRASAVPVSRRDHRNSSPSSSSSSQSNQGSPSRHGRERPSGQDDLEGLVAREVDEWRNEVLRSQEITREGLRKRATVRPRDEFDSFDGVIVVVHLRFRSIPIPIPIPFPSPSVIVAPPWHPVPLRNVVTLHSKKPRRLNPTIELPLDELLSNINATEDNHVALQQCQNNTLHMDSQTPRNNYDANLATPPSKAVKGALPQTIALAKSRLNAPTTRSSGPGTTDTSINPAVLRGTGATHTPRWRRGLNDELNCNTYGFYCRLHKRPRRKSMRAKRGETRTQAVPRQEMVDVMVRTARCYNATPQRLWRKDDEGKPICNACGLYFKLHGSARPISMKSDVIYKCSRHDARRAGLDSSETPSTSPGASRHPSPTVEPSPTLAPDSTTQLTYEYNEETTTQRISSKLMGALGQDAQNNICVDRSAYSNIFNPFPGPYHPDYLSQTSRRHWMLFLC